jgi:hypothetical protein
MYNLERQIYTGAHSLDAMDVHQAMAVVEHGAESFPIAADISVPTAKKLSTIISAYRLMDILYASNITPSTPSKNPRYAKLPRSGLVPSDKVSKDSSIPLRCYLETPCVVLAPGRLGLNVAGGAKAHGWVGEVSVHTKFASLGSGFTRHGCRRSDASGGALQGFARVFEAEQRNAHVV